MTDADAPAATLAPDDPAAVAEALAALRGQPVRLVGNASQQHAVPPPDSDVAVTRLSLAGLDRVHRLLPGDLTCSVEPGVVRAELDAILADEGLWLPAIGHGTVGGDFALDLHGGTAPGSGGPRALLLGIEGVLAEGLPFKAGARVVKSVAGFDLPRLFVGSRGRLFAVTLMHLKLRPLPARRAWFAATDLDAGEATARFHSLRLLQTPPLGVWIDGGRSGYAVRGLLGGNPRHVDGELARLGLTETPAWQPPTVLPAADREVLYGAVRPSRVADVLAKTSCERIVINGNGRFCARIDPTETDALMARAADLGCHLEIGAGDPQRHGRRSADDAGSRAVSARLRRALDNLDMLR